VIYRFNNVQLNLVNYELTVNGNKQAVEPKVFDLIIYLIQQRHRLVSRDELFEQVWQGRTVSDTSLSNHVKSARKLLGDNGDKQSVIKTIRSRGYQFIADVEELNQQANAPETKIPAKTILQPSSQVSLPAIFFSRILYRPAIWIVISLLIFAIFLVKFISSDAPEKPTLLVVPFSVSATQPANWEPFADQTTRELIQSLRKISGMKTVPPPSSFTFKNNKIREHIQQQLPDVRYILDGIVNEGPNNTLRITVELEDITNGDLLWDHDFDIKVDSTNRFSLQSEVAKLVSDSLQVLILEDEKQRLKQTPTTNLAAYDLYVLGQHQLSLMSHASVSRSIEYFQQAIELDANFEAAYIGKANAYRVLMVIFDKPKDVLPKVISSAKEVLKINPHSAQVMSLLGLAYVHTWQWDEAWNMLSQAKERDPNIALTELGFALYYSAMGNKKAVKQALIKADELDPLNEEIADWGTWALMMVNETEAAIKWGKSKVRLHPQNPYPMLGLSVAYNINQNYAQSYTVANTAVAMSQRSPLALVLFAQHYAAVGDLEQAKALILEAQQQNQYTCPYEKAVIYALSNQPTVMFELLDQAVEFQSNCLIFTKNDPRFVPYREMPEFKQLLKTIGLDDESIARYQQ
jgi:DNA-binding winged helix-turn-helix (wHTH) protein/TolB-like protein/Flp pilus assembly protein TadD